MELEFWGVRGTAPVSGRDKVKYGGRTPCASIISANGDIFIVDAGTGIMSFGEKLLKERRGKEALHLHLFLTHFHLDHIIGLPFFSPLYSPEIWIAFYSPLPARATERLLRGLMEERYFPVELLKTESKKEFRRVPEISFHIGRIKISRCPLIHPQGSVAYRFEEGEESIVFATDTESPDHGMDERLVRFAGGASLLVYDAMYTPSEYKNGRQGWGHSTWLEGTKVARAAQVREMALSHWNPAHSDKKIDRLVEQAQKCFSRAFGAREGLKRIFDRHMKVER